MGPNGSWQIDDVLCAVRQDSYTVNGTATLNGVDLLMELAEERDAAAD
jgi:hypothetical protein